MIIAFLLGGFVTWGIVYELLYSPKARVKRLWKEYFVIAREMGEMTKKYPDQISLIKWKHKTAEKKKKMMIKALLDYYFDPEENKEYIQKNTP